MKDSTKTAKMGNTGVKLRELVFVLTKSNYNQTELYKKYYQVIKTVTVHS